MLNKANPVYKVRHIVEMLAFSNVLSQYGGYLQENQPVVITGRLSMRDDKEPQIVINRARPMTDFKSETLYLRLPSEEESLFGKVREVLNAFPGRTPVVVYFADTKQRRGSTCSLDSSMLTQLTQLLGQENVVIK